MMWLLLIDLGGPSSSWVCPWWSDLGLVPLIFESRFPQGAFHLARTQGASWRELN